VDGEEQELIQGALDLALIFKEDTGDNCFVDIKSAKDSWSAFYKSRWDENLIKYDDLESFQTFGKETIYKNNKTEQGHPNAFYIEDLEAAIEELGDDYLIDNLVQLNAYCCSSFAKERKITHGVIFKYGKNDSRIFEIRFKPSEKVNTKIEKKMNDVNKAITKYKDPQRVEKDFNLGSMRCAFCEYRGICWDSDDALKEWFYTFPPRRWSTRISNVDSDTQKQLKEAFKRYDKADKEVKTKEKAEQDIIKILKELKLTKIKLDDNRVYMVKRLKDSVVLRRSKD
jgi:hypothetical protein